MAILLEKADLDKLVELTKEAQQTPVIAMSMADGLAGRDWATLAWDRVRGKWAELGKKYGFDPTRVKGINSDTGEVLT